MSCNATASLSAAGFISAQCEGTLTGNGSARLAPAALQAAPARSTASLLPAITTWPGELKFTGETTCPWADSSQALAIAALSRPMMADIAPVPSGTASCISLPRSSTRRIAAWKSSTPAQTSAEYSPRLWPAMMAGILPPCCCQTRKIATEAASNAGCVCQVLFSSSAGPCCTSCHRS
ncbi:hypothetical protein D3C71_1440760 [compost metagenome]